MLTLEDFHLAYRHATLFNGFSLNVAPGEFVMVLGRNGVGKTTLLRALAGDFALEHAPREDCRGHVSLNSTDVRQLGARQLARARAVLAQNTPNTYPARVEEVVRLGRYPHADLTTPYPPDLIVSEMLAMADATALAKRDISRLSGGEFARVQFARALTQIWLPAAELADSPRYLLLDEPTAALDIAQQHRLFATVRRLTREWNIGAFAISHDCNLVARYADRVVMLAPGSCLADGRPAKVMTDSLLEQCYGLPMRLRGDWQESVPYFEPA
jgi:iron complex transport system ATP-binding protein